MELRHKAVVLGTNYYIGLAIVRNLGRNGIHVVSVDYEQENHYGTSKYVKEKLIAPHYKDEEEAFVKFLVDYAKKEKYKPVLFLSADPYVEFLDRNFDILKEHFLFPTEKKGLLTSLMDKYELTKFTEEFGVKTPEVIASTDENLYERINNEIKYPCIVKPKDSASFVSKYRHKVFFVKSEEELREKVEMCHRDGYEIFIQRIIPGPEENCYSFDAYFDRDSKICAYLTTEKIRQWPNNFGASTYARQKWIPELYDICKPFLEGIKFRGFAEVELKRDEFTNQVYLIEVNVRFINFTEMLCHLGMNTPLMHYADSTGQKIPERYINYDTNTYWKYKYEDIPAVMGYLKSGQMSFGKIISDYRIKKVSSTWASDDPGPGLTFFSYAITNGFKKLLKRK